MFTCGLNVSPEEIVRSGIVRNAVDLCVAGYIKYIGAQASGKVAVANTTGDLAFTHGAVGAEVADTTVNPGGVTPGTIDLSADAATFTAIDQLVNASDNWEWWYESALPTDATEASGTAKIINNVAATQAKVDGGYNLLIDTSAALWHAIGITSQGQSSNPGNFDANVYHEITHIDVGSTYSSGTSILYIYEIDDRAGTVTTLATMTGAATTEYLHIPGGAVAVVSDGVFYPIYNTMNKRIVVKLVNDTAMTAAYMAVYAGTYRYGPGTRKSKLWSEY